MSGVATITAHTPTIGIAAKSSAMILSRMTTYGRAEASSGAVSTAVENEDKDENEGDKDDLVESNDKSYQRLTFEKDFADTTIGNITTGSPQRHQRQPGKASKLYNKNCSQSRQSFTNQASAIRRTNPCGGHDDSAAAAVASSSSSMMNSNDDDHQQFQQQQQKEFNKMRERLFRLLSKVPIQVEPSREANCWGAGDNDSTIMGASAQHPANCSREPLIIKYYNERYLDEILDLHFDCSLRKQRNYVDGRLALHSNKAISCKEEGGTGARSILGDPVRPQYITNCHTNQLVTPARHCSNGTSTPVHNLAHNQHQALEYQHQQLDHQHHHQHQSAEWQQPTGSEFSNFQWQHCDGNPVGAKPGSCTSDPTASTSRRLGGGSSSNSSSSSHRGSSVAPSSIVMKDIIHRGHHSGAVRKFSSCNGRAVADAPAKSARQRRLTKHQGNPAASGGGGLHGGSQGTSSPPSTASSSRTDITPSPVVSGTSATTIYSGQSQQQHSNRKQAKYCHLMGHGTELPSTDHSPGLYTSNTGANVQPQHQLAIVGGAFSQSAGIMSSTDYSHNFNGIHHHHHHLNQQTDPNQNIHLHLYTQHQPPYHHHHHHQHLHQQQPSLSDQSSGGIALTTMAGPSPSQAHFNLQPAIDQQHQQQDSMASIIPFRQAHYHSSLQTTMNHDDGQQQPTVYGSGGGPLEQEQLLQHHQHQHDNPMTTALHLTHEQLPVSGSGLQYYTTISGHPAQISLAAGTGSSSNSSSYHQLFHQHPDQPCGDSANNSWRSQLFQMDRIDEQPHQQMIEQQQQQQQHTTNNHNSHNYGTREERGFRMGPSSSCANNYSVLYANGSRQQAGVIELQLDMTLNGSQ